LTTKKFTSNRRKGKERGVPFMLGALKRWQPIKNAKINWGGGAQCSYKTRKKYYPYDDVRQVT
jgi:hypothetical protein